MTRKNPEHLKGVYAKQGRFEAKTMLKGVSYYLGLYDTIPRAALAVRLFRHWCRVGFDPDTIPRKSTYIGTYPFRNVPDSLLNRVIDSAENGEAWMPSQEDVLDMAKEIKRQRALRYSSARQR